MCKVSVHSKKKISHISAITYVHKMYNVIDNTHHFAIWKIVKGTQNLRKTSDTRLPITIPILKWILVALQHTLVEENCILLLRGIFLLAFHGFLGLVSWFLVATKFLILFYKEMTLPLYQVKEFKSFLNISRPCKITNLLHFVIIKYKFHHMFCTSLTMYINTFRHTSGPRFPFNLELQSCTPL